MSDNVRSALAGLVALLPIGTLMAAGLLGFDPPAAFVHPVIVLGGLAAALALNLPPVAKVHVHSGDGSVVAEVTVRTQGTLPNLAVLAFTVTAAGALALYLFLENCAPR